MKKEFKIVFLILILFLSLLMINNFKNNNVSGNSIFDDIKNIFSQPVAKEVANNINDDPEELSTLKPLPYNIIPYQNGWPVIEMIDIRGIGQSINVVDLDYDGRSEVILAMFGKVWVWDYKGNNLPGWPISTNSNLRGVSVGNLGEGMKLVFISGEENSSIRIFFPNGRELTKGWPKVVDVHIPRSPVLEDIDNDGVLEIIASGGSKIFAWKFDGSNVPGFPINLSNLSMGPLGFLAIGDIIGNDNQKEIAFSTMVQSGGRKRIGVVSSDGRLLNNWVPQMVDETSSENYPILADLDLDGDLEILISGISEVIAYENDGNEIFKVQTQGITNSPVVSDIDDDGYLEVIAAASKNIYVWDHQGISLKNWPVNISNVSWTWSSIEISGPVIGNIDNDKESEVILNGYKTDTRNWMIYAFNSDSSIVNGFPIKEENRYAPSDTPVLFDMDGDGDVEIISYAEKHISPSFGHMKVVAYDLPKQTDSVPLMPWPMLQQNPRRTGCCVSYPSG